MPMNERIRKLCEAISSESDPSKFMHLVTELNQLLQQQGPHCVTTRSSQPSDKPSPDFDRSGSSP